MHPSDRTFPAVLVVFAIGFNGLNGYNNAAALIEAGAINAPLVSAHFLLGALTFPGGICTMHFHSDRIIRQLQKTRGKSRTGFPSGGLFRWVGSPNYLGEIIQWIGWAVMTWSLAGVAFALFTLCNLAPRAISNHRWYREHFTDYPPERKILIPGIF